MRPPRPKPAFTLEKKVYDLNRRFVFPDRDTKPLPSSPGAKGGMVSISIAAADAPDFVKEKADLVCAGANDELTLQEGVEMLGGLEPTPGQGTIYLSEGNFNVEVPVATFGDPYAIDAVAFHPGVGMSVIGAGSASGGVTAINQQNVGAGLTSLGAIMRPGRITSGISFWASGDADALASWYGEAVIQDCSFQQVQAAATPGSAIIMDFSSFHTNGYHILRNRFNWNGTAINHEFTSGDGAIGLTIKDNFFEFANIAISLTKVRHALIQGNFADNTDAQAVVIDQCHDIALADNRWWGCGQGGWPTIRINDSNVITVSDLLYIPSQGGIDVWLSNNVHILPGTTIYEPGRYGVWFDEYDEGQGNRVTGATVVRPGRELGDTYDGIVIGGSNVTVQDAEIIGNTGSPQAQYGINVLATADSTIVLHTRYGPETDYSAGSFNDAGTNTLHVRPEETMGGGTDEDAIHDNVAGEIAALAVVTPASDDLLLIEDASDSNNKKAIEAGDLFGSGTDPDAIHDNVAAEIDALTEVTPVAGDWVLIEDASDSFNKKKVDADEFLGGGGGANVPGWITHLAERMPDETGHADDDFFDDEDFSAWTIQTVSGTATWEEFDGILSVQFFNQTAGDLAAALFPLSSSPSFPVTLETAINAVTARQDFYSYGIGFADGTGTGDDVALFRHTTGTTTTGVDAFFQSAGTLTDFAGGVNDNVNDFRIVGGLLYMRIVWTAANTFETQFSSNGRNWRTIGSAFSRTMTPTHAVLLATSQGAGSDGGVASFHYLRRNDDDPT